MASETFNETDVVEVKNPLGLNQAEIIAGLALDLSKQSKRLINRVSKMPFRIKFGFHSGPAVGGIVGHKNYQYCLFGDTVNTVRRLLSSSPLHRPRSFPLGKSTNDDQRCKIELVCLCLSLSLSSSQVGRVHLSAASWILLKDSDYFETSPRGKIEMKVRLADLRWTSRRRGNVSFFRAKEKFKPTG